MEQLENVQCLQERKKISNVRERERREEERELTILLESAARRYEAERSRFSRMCGVGSCSLAPRLG